MDVDIFTREHFWILTLAFLAAGFGGISKNCAYLNLVLAVGFGIAFFVY